VKAVVYRKDRGGVRLEELAEPVPGPGQVRIRVRYASVCGSDLFLLRSGQLPDGTVLGHEMSGTVDQLGDGADGLRQGQGVIARPVGCGDCPTCRRGEENLCPKRVAIGLGALPGAFAECLVVPRGMVIPVPEGVDLSSACLAEPMATSLHGIRLGGVRPGDRVVVLGAGGVGLAAVALLRALCVDEILVSEPQEGRRRRAVALGASCAVDPQAEELEEAVARWSRGGEVSAVLECAGTVGSFQSALRIVATGGRVVLIGLVRGTVEWAPAAAMLRQLRLQGSFANTQAECKECLEMMARGQIRVREMVEDVIPLDDLPARMESLLRAPGDGKLLIRVG